MQLLKMVRFRKTGVRVSCWLASCTRAMEMLWKVARGITILEHVLKIFGRTVQVRVKDKVKIDNMQFGLWEAKKPQMPFS